LLALAPFHAAWGWDGHQNFMSPALIGLSPGVRQALASRFPVPCEPEDRAVYARLATELELQPEVRLRPLAQAGGNGGCGPGNLLSPAEVLAGYLDVADEPDQGMDQDLPDSADPAGDREFMGGKHGTTSRGFRHMFFGGWKPAHPIATFQIPTRPLGQAPVRAELMADAARSLMKSGKVLWAFRVIAWASHYVQDLAQPFHAAQIPDLGMIPWYDLLDWPPAAAFERLVSETTRIISNYHFAYEGYVLHRIQEGPASPFRECMANPDAYLKDYPAATELSPRQVADTIAERSVGLAPEIGRQSIGLFGKGLKTAGVDLANKKGDKLDYADLTIRPDVMNARKEIERSSCVALANAVWGTRRLIDWLVRP
jgi:hypothetical protein